MLRRALIAALTGAVLLALTAPAWAQSGEGSGEAEVTGPGTVDVGATDPGSPGGNGGGGGAPTGCVYTYVNPTVPGQEEHPNGGGAYYYVAACFDNALNGLRWIPDAQGPADPAILAQRAYDQLVAPSPAIHTSPSDVRGAVVNLPTWLWVDEASLQQLSATATAGNVAVTVTARTRRVVWNTGDGARVICDGAGTPWVSGVSSPTGSSPDCGHTYRRSSAGQPGERFGVSVTVAWGVTAEVQGAPAIGPLPDLTTTAATTLRVVEYQALNTNR
jgi:hypothetical protein